MVPPGRSAPERSAARTIASAARSLTEPPGFSHSALPRTSTPAGTSARPRIGTSGVPPTRSVRSAPSRREGIVWGVMLAFGCGWRRAVAAARMALVIRASDPGRAIEEATSLDRLAANTIRFLAVDAVEQAKSGHPGTPMGLADAAYVLWTRFLRYQPHDPAWPDRDRFVLSAGHASMLLYALLHLAGVKAVNPKYETLGQPAVTLDDIRRFRQLDSRAPGHPEYH